MILEKRNRKVKITKTQLKQIIKEELQHVMGGPPKQEEELLEESLKALAAGAAMAFLTMASTANISAPDSAKSAAAGIHHIQKASGDDAAKAYAMELLIGVSKAEREKEMAAGAFDMTAKMLPTVIAKDPDIVALLRDRSAHQDRLHSSQPGIARTGNPADYSQNSPEDVEAFKSGRK
jgi:hypothetical protein|tara:strand:- start:9060 stop:9593 length:534 start_codon:yes stop_codon:yes gene_type:complete